MLALHRRPPGGAWPLLQLPTLRPGKRLLHHHLLARRNRRPRGEVALLGPRAAATKKR